MRATARLFLAFFTSHQSRVTSHVFNSPCGGAYPAPAAPASRFIVAAQFDEIRANVVVRIAEFRIELDRALAFGDGVLDAPLVVIGPAKEGMGLGGGMEL